MSKWKYRCIKGLRKELSVLPVGHESKGLCKEPAEARSRVPQKVVLRQVLGLGFLGLKCLASCRGCETTKQQLGAGLVVSGKLPMDEPCDLGESDKWVPAPTPSHMDWVA